MIYIFERKHWLRLPTGLLASGLISGSAWAIDVVGWTCTDGSGSADTSMSCGKRAAVPGEAVTASPVPDSDGYAWVSTAGGSEVNPFDPDELPGGIDDVTGVTNGASYRSAPFAVSANSPISFYFNYVTSDGGGFSDFAWARLLDESGNQAALLFTARTHPTASVVPGSGMPIPEATLTPNNIPIISTPSPQATTWEPLGDSSRECYDAGCGFSGWVEARYTIASAGTYQLEVGVVNWADDEVHSGLAVDGLLIDGLVPSQLTLEPVGPTLPAGATPQYSGTVANPGESTTVDLLVTGPGGYSETLTANIESDGSYSITGDSLSAAGEYTVVATLTGTSVTMTRSFTVEAVTPPPSGTVTAVPTLNPWILALLSGVVGLVAGLGRRNRKQQG